MPGSGPDGKPLLTFSAAFQIFEKPGKGVVVYLFRIVIILLPVPA